VLYLSENQLTSLPPEIGQLTALIVLHLYNNQLTSLPPEIGQFTALSELALMDNRLARLPLALGKLPRLSTLYLQGNPGLKLSPTILGDDPRKANARSVSAKSILDYYFGSRAKGSLPLNEVKMILVGRGGAGKTSTVRALRGDPFDADEKSTPGIALCDWELEDCKGGPVTAHVWDFAGQVITHALHQFFFSVRSVYVLVLSGRENHEREDAEYWLRLIRAFGTDEAGKGPPVIVVLNQWDVVGCRPKVDRLALKERYPFIAAFVEMDCKSKRGVATLEKRLCTEVNKLKWVREPFRPEWTAVREALADGKKKRAHLTYAEYRALCAKHGVEDAGEQDSLSEILHNLGAALNYRNDPRLREATVLQPLWLTRNVYGLVRRAEKQAGVLRQADVDAVLAKEKDMQMRKYLVQIMERFEIAYVPRTSDGGVWLVPQALPIGQPKGVESFRDAKDATHLRYTYQALPEGLVARAIVRLHEFIEVVKGKAQQWESGAVLEREGARALLRAETPLQVMITVTGPKKARQQLAGLCQAEMRDINQGIRGLDPVEETKVQGAWVSTAILEADERKKVNTGVPVPNQGTVMVDPKGPNDDYSELLARRDEVWKPTVFISYSKSNVTQRKRLESELKVLRNEGLLNRTWHDRMIDPGDEWDEKIQSELGDADVIIVMASAAALSTDYITDHEIPKALKLHKAGRTVLVPIVLEACRWSETALGPLNALPEKAKPLNKWKPSSDGWKTISDGLATVLKKLMAKKSKRVLPRSSA
jgi:GTPase SAR1 family protein